MNYTTLESATKFLKQKWPEARPACGLILGSGWSEVVEAFDIDDQLPYEDIPGLGKTGVAGHAGRLAWGKPFGLETFIFQGRRHFYEGEGWTPVAIPLYALKQLGAETVILTNAAGGIRSDMKPGDLMILKDHINNFRDNPLLGNHNPVWGPRFPDQSRVYTAELRDRLKKAGDVAGEKLFEGVYLASTGPTYETPSEIQAYKTMGADAVGMSTVPEAMLANAAGMKVAALSCITNLAAGISPTDLSHEEVTETTKASMSRMKKVLIQFWKEMAGTS